MISVLLTLWALCRPIQDKVFQENTHPANLGRESLSSFISITVRESQGSAAPSKCAVHDADDADMEDALFSRPIDQDPASRPGKGFLERTGYVARDRKEVIQDELLDLPAWLPLAKDAPCLDPELPKQAFSRTLLFFPSLTARCQQHALSRLPHALVE